MRLYIIRHADPDYDNNTITAAGHVEARGLAKRLAVEGITDIFSSPMGRAVHTMQYTSDLTGLKPAIQPWLAELDGWKVECSPGNSIVAWNIDGERVRSQSPLPTGDTWHTNPIFQQTDFAGKFEELKRSSDSFVSSLGYVREGGAYRIAQPNGRRIAVFCHMGFGLAWLAHLLELPLTLVWSGFWLAPSSVTTVLFDERTPSFAVPRCLGVGDVSHFYKEEIPASHRGLVANRD